MTERLHWSFCAVNNAPALPPGPCDCGGYSPTEDPACVELEEVAPNRWRVKKPSQKTARSDLSLPYVISDIMEPTEQVDGRLYTSKRAFRAVGRALGLTEVGNEKFKPKRRSTDLPETRRVRREALSRAVQKVKGI
jgi:hypothetical protein